ncbi:MAG TPA: DUF72 domain-containing protein [Candidatus Polarisedimenticolia bacterium]
MTSLPPGLRLGSSSWSAPSWEGAFYPVGTPAADYLAFYAREFDTVEIDATFYRAPTLKMVQTWRDRTPPGFLFAAKIPQVITHEKMLESCGEELGSFLRVMEPLGDKLGPLVFQFRYFRKDEFPVPGPFLERLERFLPALPSGMRFVVEVRNKSFVTERLLELLRRHRVALALIDHPWFPRVDQLLKKAGALTADFCYVRWLGDRHAIEAKTTRWDALVVDRAAEMNAWATALRPIVESRPVLGYFSNHYAGYAVGSIRRFREIWNGAAGAPSPAA